MQYFKNIKKTLKGKSVLNKEGEVCENNRRYYEAQEGKIKEVNPIKTDAKNKHIYEDFYEEDLEDELDSSESHKNIREPFLELIKRNKYKAILIPMVLFVLFFFIMNLIFNGSSNNTDKSRVDSNNEAFSSAGILPFFQGNEDKGVDNVIDNDKSLDELISEVENKINSVTKDEDFEGVSRVATSEEVFDFNVKTSNKLREIQSYKYNSINKFIKRSSNIYQTRASLRKSLDMEEQLLKEVEIFHNSYSFENDEFITTIDLLTERLSVSIEYSNNLLEYFSNSMETPNREELLNKINLQLNVFNHMKDNYIEQVNNVFFN